MNSVRREKIRAYVEKNDMATLGQLTQLFPDVSLMTIHRDLSYLQEQGLLRKVRGGARYMTEDMGEPAFSAREIVNRQQKTQLAQKAVALLGDSSSIFIDAGTTTMAFSGLLPDLPLHIVTTGPNIALELAKKKNPVVDLCGGTLNKRNLTLSGASAMDTLARVNIDAAFLVASGFSNEAGFTCGKESEADIKALVIKKARRVVMLLDTSKFRRLLPYTFAWMRDIDYLVTEEAPDKLPGEILEQAKAQGVQII